MRSEPRPRRSRLQEIWPIETPSTPTCNNLGAAVSPTSQTFIQYDSRPSSAMIARLESMTVAIESCWLTRIPARTLPKVNTVFRQVSTPLPPMAR